MPTEPIFSVARRDFHTELLASILTTDTNGVPSNADRHSQLSVIIAQRVSNLLGGTTIAARLPGQSLGSRFEEICAQYVERTFLSLGHLRPGSWHIDRVGSTNRLEIAKYYQFSHLIALDRAAKLDPELAAALGSDYTITPDIVIFREPEPEEYINAETHLVDVEHANLTSLREINGGLPILHASLSCKWTIRSDRAQNSRSEALNLIGNRKGHLPHIVVLTAEPLPSRIAAIALGTGEIDCVYHFALPELQSSVAQYEDAAEMLKTMVEGKRLKDISDLSFDLAV